VSKKIVLTFEMSRKITKCYFSFCSDIAFLIRHIKKIMD